MQPKFKLPDLGLGEPKKKFEDTFSASTLFQKRYWDNPNLVPGSKEDLELSYGKTI